MSFLQREPEQRTRTATVALIAALGFALRAIRIGDFPLGRDEFTTYFFATEPLRRIFSADYLAETNPPLYYLLQRAWLVFGDSETVMRLLPVALGTSCIPLLYLLARRTVGYFPACLAALLLATSPLHIEYSRIMRTYSLLSAFTLIGALLLVELFRSHGLDLAAREQPAPAPRRPLLLWGAYALVNTAILYMHNTGALFPMLTGALVVYLIAVRALPVVFLKPWIASHLTMLLLASPWLRIIVLQSHSVMPDFWIPKTTPGWAYSQFMGLYPVAKPMKPLLFGLMAWGTYCLRRQPHLLAFLLVFFIGQPLLLLAASFLQPVLIVRAMVWSTVFACIPIAVGLLSLLPRLRLAGVAGATALVLVTQVAAARKHYPDAPHKDSIAAFVGPLSSFRAEEDTLIIAPESFAWTLWYEARHLGLERSGYALAFGDKPFQLHDWLGASLVKRSELVPRLHTRRAWFLHETAPLRHQAPEDRFEGVIEALHGWGKPVRKWQSGRFELLMFERAPSSRAGSQPKPTERPPT